MYYWTLILFCLISFLLDKKKLFCCEHYYLLEGIHCTDLEKPKILGRIKVETGGGGLHKGEESSQRTTQTKREMAEMSL